MSSWSKINILYTPLRHSDFGRELANHPDKAWVSSYPHWRSTRLHRDQRPKHSTEPHFRTSTPTYCYSCTPEGMCCWAHPGAPVLTTVKPQVLRCRRCPKKEREVVYDPSPLCHSGLQYQRLNSQGRVLVPLFHSRRHHWISVENRCGGTNGKEISSLLSVWCQCAERIGSYYAFTGRITTISTPGSGLPHASLTNTQWLSTGYCKQTMTCITSSITWTTALPWNNQAHLGVPTR